MNSACTIGSLGKKCLVHLTAQKVERCAVGEGWGVRVKRMPDGHNNRSHRRSTGVIGRSRRLDNFPLPEGVK